MWPAEMTQMEMMMMTMRMKTDGRYDVGDADVGGGGGLTMQVIAELGNLAGSGLEFRERTCS